MQILLYHQRFAGKVCKNQMYINRQRRIVKILYHKICTYNMGFVTNHSIYEISELMNFAKNILVDIKTLYQSLQIIQEVYKLMFHTKCKYGSLNIRFMPTKTVYCKLQVLLHYRQLNCVFIFMHVHLTAFGESSVYITS